MSTFFVSAAVDSAPPSRRLAALESAEPENPIPFGDYDLNEPWVPLAEPRIMIPQEATESPILHPLSPEHLAILMERLALEPTPEQLESLETRVLHAKELLGKHYWKSAVKAVEGMQNATPIIEEITRKYLPKKWKKKAASIARAIVRESEKHELDPIFTIAVIQNESSFVPDQVGPYGEIGLMQLREETARWICKKTGIRYRGKKSLNDPLTNIRIGTAFLASLREQFDSHSRLYLSAYNMGAGNVRKNLAKQVWPKFYVSRVMQRYVKLYRDVQKKNALAARGPSNAIASQ